MVIFLEVYVNVLVIAIFYYFFAKSSTIIIGVEFA